MYHGYKNKTHKCRWPMKAWRSGGVVLMAWRGVKQVHSIAFDKRKLLLVLSCINIAVECLPIFKIFKDKHLRGNYIYMCETDACMAIGPNACMIVLLFIVTFVTCMQARGEICHRISITFLYLLDTSFTSQYMLWKKSHDIGLDLLTLPHMSNVLHPHDIFWLKTMNKTPYDIIVTHGQYVV